MSKIYTIGFTKKSAERFFDLLLSQNINKVIDVRLNNSSQLAGFSKGEDLQFFLDKIGKIQYFHELIFAPTKNILDGYKKGEMDWTTYEKEYDKIMVERDILAYIEDKGADFWNGACLLCSEDEPQNCHRRLAALEILSVYPELDVIHLH
ncbi:MAG: DUF488 domain-containing protein [Lachnospiraceae bacterium]|nr:DUF488 domain-containing protein [Lachnospiraceae bacterium]